MNITFLRYWICPLDETITDPIIGRVDEEDLDNGLYLASVFDVSSYDHEGYVLLTTDDLRSYRVFKGKEEAAAYISAAWP